MGHLLHVETALKTHRNLSNLAAKPKKIQQKRKGLDADDDIYEVR